MTSGPTGRTTEVRAEFPGRWARSSRSLPESFVHSKGEGDEVLESHGLVPNEEVLDLFREPSLVGAAQRVVIPTTVGSQGTELQGVFCCAPGPLCDAVQPPGRISSVNGVIKCLFKFLGEE